MKKIIRIILSPVVAAIAIGSYCVILPICSIFLIAALGFWIYGDTDNAEKGWDMTNSTFLGPLRVIRHWIQGYED